MKPFLVTVINLSHQSINQTKMLDSRCSDHQHTPACRHSTCNPNYQKKKQTNNILHKKQKTIG